MPSIVEKVKPTLRRDAMHPTVAPIVRVEQQIDALVVVVIVDSIETEPRAPTHRHIQFAFEYLGDLIACELPHIVGVDDEIGVVVPRERTAASQSAKQGTTGEKMRYVETIENVVDAVDGANDSIELDGRSLARDFRLEFEVL